MQSRYTSGSAAGITEANRRLLTTLHRKTTGPFTAAEAAVVLALDSKRTRRFLAYLAERGWLARVHQGLYVVVPLDASNPTQWREDPWIVASRYFAPCYIGGWSACEYWGLTEQIFRSVAVVTEHKQRRSSITLQGTDYVVKTVRKGRIFGTHTAWRRQVRVQVSDPSRTVIDLLDDPALGGGVRHIADVLGEYFSGKHRNDDLLIDYGIRLGNRTVFKRLGYFVEALQLDALKLVETARARRSAGLSPLDPTVRSKGTVLKRWNLRVNVDLHTGRGSM